MTLTDFSLEMTMTMDYQSSERPRDSWTERIERENTSPSSKRDPDDRPRRTISHLPQSDF